MACTFLESESNFVFPIQYLKPYLKGTNVIIQIIKFESELPEDQVLATALDRSGEFRALPGLVQKYYAKLEQPNQYGGIYVWDSMEALATFRESDLAASIPREYKVKGKPTVEILDVLIQLRE